MDGSCCRIVCCCLALLTISGGVFGLRDARDARDEVLGAVSTMPSFERPAERAQLREKLLLARDQAPLFDAKGFASDLEALFERMWARFEAGQAPAPLPASAHGG